MQLTAISYEDTQLEYIPLFHLIFLYDSPLESFILGLNLTEEGFLVAHLLLFLSSWLFLEELSFLKRLLMLRLLPQFFKLPSLVVFFEGEYPSNIR